MRSTTLRFALPLLAALAAAGCKKEGIEGPEAVCRPVSTPCSLDSDCCSYGCLSGSCRQNPLEAGACRTSDDCQYPRVCVDQQCTSSVACRGGGSTCFVDGDCCSGDCATSGQCAVDVAPVAQAGADALPDRPYRIAIPLSGAASTDPNTGTLGLLYEWSVLQAPAGSTAQPTPAGLVDTVFTPDVAHAVTPYVLQLKVTKGALSSTDTVTFRAVNTPPVITMPADLPDPANPTAPPTYQSRNVALAFSATVSDADGGPVTCSWSKTSPSAVTTPVSGPTTCAGASGTAATGQSGFTLDEDEAGTWKLTLTADDGVNPPVAKDRFVNVQNDPPVANAGPKRWGNYSLGSIPVSGTATDPNDDVVNANQGDATFTWLWTVTAAPAGSAQVGTTVGATPSVSFTPDSEGLYTLTLTVDDHHGGPGGGSDSASVDVQVEPYILPLGEVADAEYVDGTNHLVLVETGAGNAHILKVVDPATLEVVDQVALAARPTSLALNPTATEALVGEAGGLWERVTGISATPALAVATTAPALSLPSDLVDLVHAGGCAFGVVGGGSVYQLFPQATGATGTYSTEVTCPTCTAVDAPAGMRLAATPTTGLAPTLWLLQTGTGRLARYGIHTNCNLQTPAVRTDGALAGKAGLWLGADGADLFTAWTSVYDAANLQTRVTTPLPVTPEHLETTQAGAQLVGAVAQSSTSALATFSRNGVGTAFTAGAPVAFPMLGSNGDAVANFGRLAFVRAGGGAYYAIVRANVGTASAPQYRWGLVNLAP